MTLYDRLKETVTIKRFNTRTSAEENVGAGSYEVVIVPNIRPNPITETGQVIVDSTHTGYAEPPVAGLREGDIVVRSTEERLFITFAPELLLGKQIFLLDSEQR